MKLGRLFELSIQIQPGSPDSLVMRSPLTLELDIVRDVQATANSANLIIYNLGEDNRQKLFKYAADPGNLGAYRQVQLKAGYEGSTSLPIVFQGSLRQGYSVRRGPDLLTTVVAFDGDIAMANGQANITVPAGYNRKEVIETLIKTMPTVNIGAVSEFEAESSRGLALAGNSWDTIRKLNEDGHNFIDNELVYVLKKNEFIIADTVDLNSDTGLIGTPCVVNLYQTDVQMIFEPRVKIGMVVNLLSRESRFNGRYIVKGISHRGTISGAVGGELVTTLNLWPGPELVVVGAAA